MKEIKIVSRYDKDRVLVCGKYESIKDCLEKNKGADLSGADLSGADLSGANLSGANLSGADLSRANLSGAENYSQSHDIFIQLIRDNSNKFTKHEKEVASMIFAFRLCWDSIKKEYKTCATKIFKKLNNLGWGEYLTEWRKP